MAEDEEFIAEQVMPLQPQVPIGIQDLQWVFEVCGITTEAVRTRLIQNEGFQTLEDIGSLEGDNDVTEMAKRLAGRTIADGRVLLGTLQIKNIQALVWWVRDKVKRGQPLLSAEFNAETMAVAKVEKWVESKRTSATIPVSDLGVFKPEDFDTHEDAFLNMLAQTFGGHKEPIRYVVRPDDPPETFIDEAQRRSFQLPLFGPQFDEDNRVVYRKLKSFLINTPGYVWIEPFNATENGRAAFKAWANHYNGEGELSKRTALAKTQLKLLHYKSEASLSFERYTELMTKAFTTLDKDPEEKLTDRQKVEKFLVGVKTSSPELIAAKSVISQNYTRDFPGACSFFAREVGRVFGTVQVEQQIQRQRKRRISQLSSGRGGRSRGNGNRGRGRGRGRGRAGPQGNNLINGVDVSNPTRSFTAEEWDRLGFNGGRQYVVEARERIMRARGGGRDGNRDGNRAGRGGRNIHQVDRSADTVSYVSEVSTHPDQGNRGDQASRGSQHGRGFGRGAYRGGSHEGSVAP